MRLCVRDSLATSEEAQRKRWDAETKVRSQRLSHGLMGIWHRLTGKHEKIQRQNEMDTLHALQRDRKEKDELEIELLRQDIRDYDNMRADKHSRLREEYREISESPERPRRAKQGQDREEDHGYDDPATYLPQHIQNLLNATLPPERLFSAPNIPTIRLKAD